MTVIQTAELRPGSLDASSNHQVYCGLDSAITLEVNEELGRQFNQPPAIYSFTRELQGPYLDMMRRGFAVDSIGRHQAAQVLRRRLGGMMTQLDRLAMVAWDRPLNARSSDQLKSFFYLKMRLPEVWQSQKGQRKLSMNREALEKLETHLYARPFISLILAIRDLSKQLEVLETSIDSDGRFRTSYNIVGTETGRPSSSENAFGTGGNAQNISPGLRYVFVSDPGYKLAVIDLEQVEARDVGFFCGCLFNDWSYLDACECVTEDHEVLTSSGWTSIATKPESIAIWHPGSRSLEFESVSRWNESETTELVEANSISMSIRATKNHTMPVYSYRGYNTEKVALSKLMQNPKGRVAPNTVDFVGGSIHNKDTALIAAFQADGTRDPAGKVHWTFVKIRKIEKMRKLLKEGNFKYSEYELETGATRFYLSMGQGQENWPKLCGAEILSWDRESLRNFCNSHLHWDAHNDLKGPFNSFRITAKSYEHLDWVATAYMLCGNAVSINRHKKDYWVLKIRTMRNLQYRSANFQEVVLNSPVKVYCPTVSTGFFLLRREGKIYVSGNSGDLHTNNARRIWPELGWSGDPAGNRRIADGQFYRDFSYRDMAKRGSHLSNYMGTAWTASRFLKVPLGIMEEFQARYIRGRKADNKRSGAAITPAFPVIAQFWDWIAAELQTTSLLETPFGRRRHFFGRPGDDTTLREAIAFMPQSTTADRTNLGLWRIWKKMPEVQVLAQTYDSVTFQYREGGSEYEAQILLRALELMRVELIAPSGRAYVVPGEAKIGWNWGNAVTEADIAIASAAGRRPPRLNPGGLRKWSATRPDTRQRPSGSLIGK